MGKAEIKTIWRGPRSCDCGCHSWVERYTAKLASTGEQHKTTPTVTTKRETGRRQRAMIMVCVVVVGWFQVFFEVKGCQFVCSFVVSESNGFCSSVLCAREKVEVFGGARCWEVFGFGTGDRKNVTDCIFLLRILVMVGFLPRLCWIGQARAA